MSDEIKNQLDKMDIKIDKLDTRLDSIDVTLGRQHESLIEHMRRTALLEQQIEPIKKHVAQVSGVFKFIGFIGVVAGIAEGIFTILSYFNHHL